MSETRDTGKVIEGHEYDGIQELDYGPPKWFNALFYVTIAFGAVYFVHYQLGGGLSQKEEWQKDHNADQTVILAAAQATGASAGGGGADEGQLAALVKDESRKKQGNEVYQGKCASCHGAKGEGGIGPNLTDDNWIHGGTLVNIAGTITNGVGDKGMPPWGPLLKPEEIQSVTAFIRSIRGTNPPNAKAPQGDLVKL